MINRQVNVGIPTTDAQWTNHEDKSEWLQTRPGERCLIRVSAADTHGAYSVVEIVADPGDGTPIHIHQNEDEHFIILEGMAHIAYGEKTFDAAAGTADSPLNASVWLMRARGMIGKTYLERGLPVVVVARWNGKGPRNVLIRRGDGSQVVRPFRGLRKPPELK